MSSKNIDDVRAILFDALEAVKTGALDLDKARRINELAKTLVDTAKVEVDYLRATGGAGESAFIGDAGRATAPQGITGVTRHRLGR